MSPLFTRYYRPPFIGAIAFAGVFLAVPLAHSPIKLVTAAVGDLDGDGVPEIVTGALHAFPPYDRLSNITLWRRK